ncbi:MAG: hypothetical protein ACE5JL_14915, partial [Dehalococcoidia bacterium]
MALDLQEIPIIDGHCHPPIRRQPRSLVEFKGFFTESRDPRIVSHHVQHTLFYQQSLRDLASLMGLGDTVEPETVLARRSEYPLKDYLTLTVKQANIRGLVVDYGYRTGEAYDH